MLRILVVTGPGLNFEDTLSAEGSPLLGPDVVLGVSPKTRPAVSPRTDQALGTFRCKTAFGPRLSRGSIRDEY